MSTDPDDLERAAELLREAAREDYPGETLKEVRSLLDLTLMEMGRKLGLKVQADQYNCSTLTKWENGDRQPQLEGRKKLRAFADELQEKTEDPEN